MGPLPAATAPHLSRFKRARKAASHLISSSSLGAQRTNVRLAVTIRKVWSSEGVGFSADGPWPSLDRPPWRSWEN